MEPFTQDNPNSLFDVLPFYSVQDELLSVQPVPVNVESVVKHPVARVYLDIPLPHMAQLFDYEIPPRFADLAIGARVKVELGQRKVDGFVAARGDTTMTAGKLRQISSVVSNTPVLQPQIKTLLEQLAEEYVSPIADLFRLAIPQRHARAEKEFFELPPVTPLNTELVSSFQEPTQYQEHIYGKELVCGNISALRPVSLIHCLPEHDLEVFVRAIQRTLEDDGSVLILAPTPREVVRLASKLGHFFPLLSIGQWVSTQNHAMRYTQFLSALEGRTRVIVGTRSAIWAPMRQLQLIVQFDDAHSAYQERRSPYLNAREVLLARAKIEKAQYCIASSGPSIAGVSMLRNGDHTRDVSHLDDPDVAQSQVLAQIITPNLIARKHFVPQLLGANQFQYESSPWSRMPSALFTIVREGLTRGAVLIIVPKAGYIPRLVCANCGAIAQCGRCNGQLEIPAVNSAPSCKRCGFIEQNYRCVQCNGVQLKSSQIGSERTALEIGRAFPGVPINLITNNSEESEVKSGQIVVATPGSEPTAATGYAAAVVLDCGYLLSANNLDAEANFLRAIAKIMRLVKTRDAGGKILLVGDVPTKLVDVLGRWDFPKWELDNYAERVSLKLPPADSWFAITGTRDDLRRFLGYLRLAANEIILQIAKSDLAQSAPAEMNFRELDDPLAIGGVHRILPNAQILGPKEVEAGKLQILLHPDSSQLNAYQTALNRVNRVISINRNAPSIRIRRNPPL